MADGTYSQPTDIPYKHYTWDKAVFVDLNNYIGEVDWLGLMSVNLLPNDIWAAYTNIIRKGVDRFAPSVIDSNNFRPNTKAKTKVKSYRNYKRKAMARKQSLWRLHRNNPSNSLIYESYHKAESKCCILIFKLEVKQENAIINSNNLGSFYKYPNRKLSNQRGIWYKTTR